VNWSDAWLSHPARCPELLGNFTAFLAGLKAPVVVEMGARRSNPEVSTLHRDWAPADAIFIGTDFMPGVDVDVIADAHRFSEPFAPNSIDGIICVSVMEHIERPWIVAKEIAKTLRYDGQIFCYTHFAFPKHGYPSDYFRFTRAALEMIFKDAGLEIIASDYENPCLIVTWAEPDLARSAFTGCAEASEGNLPHLTGG
jgi:predicted SAM-dependent methyltransferase